MRIGVIKRVLLEGRLEEAASCTLLSNLNIFSGVQMSYQVRALALLLSRGMKVVLYVFGPSDADCFLILPSHTVCSVHSVKCIAIMKNPLFFRTFCKFVIVHVI